MSNRVTGLFFMTVSCLVVCFYTANLLGWLDYANWGSVPSDFISSQYEHFSDYVPIFYLILAWLVLMKMTFISYAMGRTEIVIPQKERQLLPTTMFSAFAAMHEKSEDNKNDAIRERHLQQINQRQKQIMSCVLEYVELTMAPYMKDEDLQILFDNIRNWEASKEIVLSPSITNGQLSTLDLRILAL